MVMINSSDEDVLIESMQVLRTALERVGISGDAIVTAQADGNLTLIAALDKDTELNIKILDNDTEKRVKYCQR